MPNLWDRFSTQAEATAGEPALIFGEQVTSFASLYELARRCADELTARGVGKGDVVALHLTKRRLTYALLLACLRIGAPYVFLDPNNPVERTGRMLARIRPALMFSNARVDGAPCPVLVLEDGEDTAWIGSGSSVATGARDPGISGTDPAYIMFTSGSTGEPKGAVIPHQGVLGLMAWARSEILCGGTHRFTAINPLHFDNSVFDIYCGLCNGAALVPVETGEITSPVTWLKIIRSGEAGIMFAVPTLFLILDDLGLLTPASLPKVHTFVFGGEGFPIGRLRDFHGRFADKARLINVYGPTETSCICSSVSITPEMLVGPNDAFPPLGHMHRDFTHAIFDENLHPVTAGEVGELWIGGPSVGLGYYDNRQETEARFRQDPRQDRFRAIYYRSGDLVREDCTGQLWFQGRADNQVKIRGYRIELEEIDHAVETIPGVRRALTVIVPGDDGAEVGVVFVAKHPIADDDIRAQCARKLPAYMRPAHVLQVEALPLNANGKADRRSAQALYRRETAA